MLELCCPPVIDSYHYHIWNILLDTWIWDIFLPGKIVSDYWPMVINKSWKTFLFCTSLPREICATQTVISDIQIFCFNPDFTTSTTIWWGISPNATVTTSNILTQNVDSERLPHITKLLLSIILIGPLVIWLIYLTFNQCIENNLEILQLEKAIQSKHLHCQLINEKSIFPL